MQNDHAKTPLQKQIELNQCPTCQFLQFAVCQCPAVDPGVDDCNDNDEEMDDALEHQVATQKPEQDDDFYRHVIEQKPIPKPQQEFFTLDGHVFGDMAMALGKLLALAIVDNDPQRGLFSIQAKPGLAKHDVSALDQLFSAVKSVFDAFTIGLSQQGIANHASFARRNQSMTIQMQPQHYSQFLNHLNHHFSTNAQSPESENEVSPTHSLRRLLNPFHKVPRPKWIVGE